MSHIVIVTKPSYALTALPALETRYPGRRILGVLDGAVSLLTIDHPRGLSMSDYPLVSEPKWRPNPKRMTPGACYDITDGQRRAFDIDPFQSIRDAKEVICADGLWFGGAANFDMLMRHVGGEEFAARPHRLLRATTLKAEEVRRHVEIMGSTLDADFIAWRDGGLVKRRFDWCFAVNSQVLLGEAHRRATGAQVAPPIGKYALQLLYAMREADPSTESALITLLTKWPGTGRYATGEKPTVWMGSAISVGQILEDVMAMGLTTTTRVMRNRREVEVHSLNDAGHRFLDALHPDCRDPDLPWRVASWQEGGRSSEPKVDRYIRTFFGKQKRFAAARRPA